MAAVSGASGVATDGSFAYVGTSAGIDVVDVSTPTAPNVLSTFGTGDLAGLGVEAMQVYNNELVVLGQPSSGGPSTLLIYSLATPSAPTLLGQTPLTYQSNQSFNIEGFTISGGHVYTTSHHSRFLTSNGQIFEQYGQSFDVDITNPMAATVDGVIFNDPPNSSDFFPAEGTSNFWQVAAVNSNVLLIGTTTATGTDDGSDVNGLVMVVDTSNPASPAVLEKLTIPGMGVVTGISVQGNQAFVIGSTGTFQSGYLGLFGNIVVATLDLSNPESPVIIAEQALNIPSVGSSELVSLGNNQFVTDSLSGTSTPSQILVFDDSDPEDVVVSQVSVPNTINDSDFTVSGGMLFTADDTNLSIYNIGQTEVTPVTAQVTIPTGGGVSIVPGSFNIAPSNTVTGTGSETLEWDFAFAPGDTSQTITFQEALTGLVAGGSIPAVQGGTVEFATGTTTTGSVTSDTMTLPGQIITGDQIIGLQHVDPNRRPRRAGELRRHRGKHDRQPCHVHVDRPGRAGELGRPAVHRHVSGGRDDGRTTDADLERVHRCRRLQLLGDRQRRCRGHAIGHGGRRPPGPSDSGRHPVARRRRVAHSHPGRRGPCRACAIRRPGDQHRQRPGVVLPEDLGSAPKAGSRPRSGRPSSRCSRERATSSTCR